MLALFDGWLRAALSLEHRYGHGRHSLRKGHVSLVRWVVMRGTKRSQFLCPRFVRVSIQVCHATEGTATTLNRAFGLVRVFAGNFLVLCHRVAHRAAGSAGNVSDHLRTEGRIEGRAEGRTNSSI